VAPGGAPVGGSVTQPVTVRGLESAKSWSEWQDFSALRLLTSSWRVAPNRLGAERLHKLPVPVAIIRGQA
jgi:hypothetical protein